MKSPLTTLYYGTALDTLGAERERDRFSEGFRMGVRLGAECFGE